METMFWVWLAVIAISLIIEIVTLDLVSVWFAFGALIPFILSAIGGIAVEIQIAVFVVVTALLIIFLRKYAQKLLFKNMNTKTNVDSLVGKTYRLLEDTDFEHIGSVKVNDVVWTAVSEDGSLLKKGSLVEIVNVDGNKLVVKKSSKTENEEPAKLEQEKSKDESKDEIKVESKDVTTDQADIEILTDTNIQSDLSIDKVDIETESQEDKGKDTNADDKKEGK